MWCSERENLLKETLEKQFEVVKERVSRNGTYMQGSHVLQFGSLAIDEEPAADYLGHDNTGKPSAVSSLAAVTCQGNSAQLSWGLSLSCSCPLPLTAADIVTVLRY